MKFMYHQIRFRIVWDSSRSYEEFRSELGFLGNFGLVKSYAMEPPKKLYDLNEFLTWKYVWLGGSIIDTQKLTESKITENNSLN